MQRRAAAGYVAFFLVLAIGAYAFMAVSHAPTVSIDDPEHTLEKNSTFSVNGRQYTVTEISSSTSSGGGHGGGGGVSYTGVVQWVNGSAIHTVQWPDRTNVTYNANTYTVLIPNETDPSGFTLRETPGNDTETVTRDGTTYVIVEEGNNTYRRVPIDEYQGLTRHQFREGDPLSWNGNSTTVVNVTSAHVRLQWRYATPVTTEFSQGANVTLNGVTYVAYFPNGHTAYLSRDIAAYQHQVHQVKRYHERMKGVWGVMALSALAAFLLVAMAYLPRKE